MSAGKHTPGPWSVPHFAKPDVNCQCGYVLSDGLMGAVATVHCSGDGDDFLSHGDNPRFEEAVANARLIAAAPDLAEALKPFADLGVGCGPDDECDAASYRILRGAIRNARAALAKAVSP